MQSSYIEIAICRELYAVRIGLSDETTPLVDAFANINPEEVEP
jgi:hypothetical protein